MAGETIELEYMLGPDHMAVEIANKVERMEYFKTEKD